MVNGVFVDESYAHNHKWIGILQKSNTETNLNKINDISVSTISIDFAKATHFHFINEVDKQ